MKNILFLLLSISTFSQGYTSYFTGNTTNITTNTEFGVCLMGGATENDNAIKWLMQKANGGDIVVLRCTGTSGYNNYMYSGLGLTVNSVETLVITSAAGATNPYVLNKVANAEMIWFAGGDQSNYVNFFKNNALEDLLNAHVNTKNAPIGGTSAGMAILGGKYFSALNGSVTSAQAMANPYVSNVTLGNNDFLNIPFLSNVISDTHFDNPDRKGRFATFLARYKQDFGGTTYGIASNEYTAVCIDNSGKARVFGDYPTYPEYAYFVQPNCENPNGIENCNANQALTWNFNGQALKVYKVPGTQTGTNFFNVTNWESLVGQGGTWENWSVVSGTFGLTGGNAPSCLLQTKSFYEKIISIIPNPIQDEFIVDGINSGTIFVYDALGKLLVKQDLQISKIIKSTHFNSGIYFVKIQNEHEVYSQKIIK